MTGLRRRAAALACGFALAAIAALSLGRPTCAYGLAWPDVTDRVARDLTAPDGRVRLSAARQIASLDSQRAAELALVALGDDDLDVRLAAADAAIRLRAAGATDAVLAWLNAPDPRLRRQACEVARAMPSPRAAAPLARALGDPDADVRAAAAGALGREPAAEAVAPLLGRLDDPAPAVRVTIVGSLSQLTDPRSLIPLIGKIEDSSVDVRQAVARALGDLADARASPALVMALRDQSADVRREALVALGRVRASEAVDAIAPLLSDRVASIRVAALQALGAIRTPEALKWLVSALGTGDDSDAVTESTPVRAALVAAATPGDAASVDLGPDMHAVLTGASSVRAATSAAWVLGALRMRREAPALVDAVRRGTLPSAAGLHALAGAGSANELAFVLEFLDDPSPRVREQAARAAFALLDPQAPDGRAVEPIASALRDAHLAIEERSALAALLGRTGASRAAPVLVSLVRGREPLVRLAALDALGTLGPAGADDDLLAELADRSADVRLHAAVALARAGGPHARDILSRALEAGTEHDRGALLTALGGILSRVPDEASLAVLADALRFAAGADRDAVLDAIATAGGRTATRALVTAATSVDPADRRTAAAALAASRSDQAARRALRALLGDPDESVRAEAAWSMGTAGDFSDLARLRLMVASDAASVATDAVAAIGRIGARLKDGGVAPALCAFVADRRRAVRANALAGLAFMGERCAAASERAVLASDPSDLARAAAARMLHRREDEEDRRALDRCAHGDRSGAVATVCAEPFEPSADRSSVLVYVLSETATEPRPRSFFALVLGDGMMHVGYADRRGATFDPMAPEGAASLGSPVDL